MVGDPEREVLLSREHREWGDVQRIRGGKGGGLRTEVPGPGSQRPQGERGGLGERPELGRSERPRGRGDPAAVEGKQATVDFLRTQEIIKSSFHIPPKEHHGSAGIGLVSQRETPGDTAPLPAWSEPPDPE